MALRSGSLEELKKEPWRLQIQADTTSEQLRGLVLRNYHVFIQSNQSANIVKQELTELKSQTESIANAIPELKHFCTNIQDETETIVTKHSDIQFVFDHYMELTELLEIPQLLEACIHNELFDSALDVIQFAKDAFKDDLLSQNGKAHKNGANVVIQTLIREVVQMTTLLREKLLQKLREDLQLALCVRIVSYLRRLDSLLDNPADSSLAVGTTGYERQLKEEFLRCRSTWLASLSRNISTSDAYQFTIQLIDVKRTSWFDMITQYSAIFGNENVDGKVDPPLCRWATTTVADFIQVLMRQLPKIEDFSSLSTVIEQSLFFGGSLGRVGVDFRAMLVVYFEDHVFDRMSEIWEGACRDFQESLACHSLSNSTSSGSKTPIVLASYRNALANSQGVAFSSNSNEDFSPPRVLMSFPILAELTNSFLTSFNDLRLCTITSLQSRLTLKLQDALGAVLMAIDEFCRGNQLKLKPRSNDEPTKDVPRPNKTTSLSDSIRDMNEVFALTFLPYIARCFERLFAALSTKLAPSSALSTINVPQLVAQMKERNLLLPSIEA